MIHHFGIIQDDTTRRSWLWNEKESRWKECPQDEFEPLLVLANYLRQHDDPEEVLRVLCEEGLKIKTDDKTDDETQEPE